MESIMSMDVKMSGRFLDAVKSTKSEFYQFTDMLRSQGIDYSINWGPTKKEWQRVINRAGYNVTALACTVVEVGDNQHLFCNGKVIWDKDEKGYGPEGLYMLTRNKRTRRVINRIYGGVDGHSDIFKGPSAIIKKFRIGPSSQS